MTLPFSHPWVTEIHKSLFVLRLPDPYATQELQDYFENYLQPWVVAADAPYAWVLHVVYGSAKDRNLVAAWRKRRVVYEKKFCAGQAFVVTNAITRNGLTAMNWLSPPPFPTAVFADEAPAVVWARKMLGEWPKRRALAI